MERCIFKFLWRAQSGKVKRIVFTQEYYFGGGLKLLTVEKN